MAAIVAGRGTSRVVARFGEAKFVAVNRWLDGAGDSRVAQNFAEMDAAHDKPAVA